MVPYEMYRLAATRSVSCQFQATSRKDLGNTFGDGGKLQIFVCVRMHGSGWVGGEVPVRMTVGRKIGVDKRGHKSKSRKSSRLGLGYFRCNN